MAAPSINDLRKYIGVILGSAPWNYNLSQIVSFLTTNYDLTGNNITATQFFGDISNCTGFPNQTVDVISGGTIVSGDAVRIDSGVAFVCTLSDAGITNFIGIATNNASVGQTVNISRFSYSGYTSLVTDDTYYIDTDGAITNTKPTSYAKPIGFAISDTDLVLSQNSEADVTFSKINTTGAATVGGVLNVGAEIISTGSIQAGPAVAPFLASPFKVARLDLPSWNISGGGAAPTSIDVSEISTDGSNVISYSIKLVSDDGLITVDPTLYMSASSNSGIGDFLYPYVSLGPISGGNLTLTTTVLSGGVYDAYSSFYTADTGNWDGTVNSRGFITFLYI